MTATSSTQQIVSPSVTIVHTTGENTSAKVMTATVASVAMTGAVVVVAAVVAEAETVAARAESSYRLEDVALFSPMATTSARRHRMCHMAIPRINAKIQETKKNCKSGTTSDSSTMPGATTMLIAAAQYARR